MQSHRQACPDFPPVQQSRHHPAPGGSFGGSGAFDGCPCGTLVAPSGTPLPLMLEYHPSGALRGYDSGERGPSCPAPWSHAAVQHPRSNYTPGWPAAPGEVSHHQNLSACNGNLAQQAARRRTAMTSLVFEFGHHPLRVPTCCLPGKTGGFPSSSDVQEAPSFLLGFLLQVASSWRPVTF